MKEYLLLTLTVLSVFLSASGFAQKPKDPCDHPQETSEIQRCSGVAWQEADTQLNQTYRQLVALLSLEEKESLKNAQQAWLKFRDLHCEFQTYKNKGGTLQGTFQRYCQADLTRARTKQLKELIQGEKGQ